MSVPGFDFSTVGLYHERLCLDFVNSAPSHQEGSGDRLNTYADLLTWSLDVSLLDAEESDRLYARALGNPEEAALVVGRAVALREAIFAVLSDLAHRRVPSDAALEPLNRALPEAAAHMRLNPSDSGVGWRWEYEADDLAKMLGPVIWSAIELMQSDDRNNLRECEGQDCDWLFLDTSRNHSRRWCSMETCGNRAKARRHQQRKRAG